MIELGIDELTIVLQIPSDFKENLDPSDWPASANELIDMFVEKADFLTIFGKYHGGQRPPEGYTFAYTFGEHNFYLAAAYHDMRIDMGVVIKFSAQALDYYTEQSGLRVYQLLQKMQDEWYTTRVSRVDLTVDYIDEDVDVTRIYKGLIDKRIAVFREAFSRYNGEITLSRADLVTKGFVVGEEIPTAYLGSPHSNARLRIYDKKREQMERLGNKLMKAQSCDSWVRFEGVFRHEFAHQIGESLLEINNDDELGNMIANVMIQKFRMKDINEGVIVDDTDFTKNLMSCIYSKEVVLRSPVSRNYDLAKSLRYLFSGSGLITCMQKIRIIWGDDALEKVFDYIRKIQKRRKPNSDCEYWLERNVNEYRKNHSSFEEYWDECVYKKGPELDLDVLLFGSKDEVKSDEKRS